MVDIDENKQTQGNDTDTDDATKGKSDTDQGNSDQGNQGEKSQDNSAIKQMRERIKAQEAELKAFKAKEAEEKEKKLKEDGKLQELLENEKKEKESLKKSLIEKSVKLQIKETFADINPDSEFKDVTLDHIHRQVETDDEGNITNLDELRKEVETKFPSIFAKKSNYGTGKINTQGDNGAKMTKEKALEIINSGNNKLYNENLKLIQEALK